MLRNFNQGKKNKMCIKIDLHKAFDKLNRSFIIHMLRKIGFHEKFCDSINECISNVTYSILVNGSPSGFIHNKRGNKTRGSTIPLSFHYSFANRKGAN